MNAPPAKTLSVVVPVYFNAASLPILFQRLSQVETRLDAMDVRLQLIFVDDGSGDESFGELLKIKAVRPQTTLVKLTRNFGADAATKCGFAQVTGDCFLVLSADLQDPPELIPELAERWLGGAKFIVCERSGRDDGIVSQVTSGVYYRLLRLLVMPDYPAGGYDLALFDRRFLPYLRDASKSVSTLVLAYWLGFKPEVIPYRREKRVHGTSRWTFRKKVAAFLDVILGFSVKPLRLMSLVGFGVAAVSFAYGLMIVAYAVAGIRPVPGFASIVVLISFLLGVIIVMLGMIGEYLARILDEVSRRPEVVVEEIL